ncbi:MAG: hypothetical protein Q4D31_00740 [Eubacteriales bacterium]|nr:hypothetical protein [Eubacteriales bacterium]
MKKVLLSHDYEMIMYLVPDDVADNLEKYCMYFCGEWIWNNPNGEKLLVTMEDGEKCAMYGAQDFIDYLNDYVFPEQKSMPVAEMDFCSYEIPKEHKDIPWFNF